MKPVVINGTRWIIVGLFLGIIINFYSYQDSFGQFRIPNSKETVQEPSSGIETSPTVQPSQDEGLVNIHNITQQDNGPQTDLSQQEEEMAMKATFDLTHAGNYELTGFGFNVNNGSLLCLTNNCEFTFNDGILHETDDGGYVLEGSLNVAEKIDNKSSKSFDVNADLTIHETLQQGPGVTNMMTGFFNVRSLPHYYVYNGTFSQDSNEYTLILQGKVLPKMS
jgi:hypothetical protein